MAKGWFNESKNHAKAAKGIKTRMNFGSMPIKKQQIQKKKFSKVAVPPAWQNVKFYEDKPYVATGIDSKGRTQYIYTKKSVNTKADKKFRRTKAVYS